MPHNFDIIPSRRDPLLWNKWTAYPPDVLPMWLADADFPTAPQIQAALNKQVKHGVLGYEIPQKPFMETIASRMKILYNWDVDPDWIVYTAGVNNGYNIAARILCSKQKGYLIQTPVYNEFYEAEVKTGIPVRIARLEEKTSKNRIRYEVDFDAFERGVKKSGMFLLCNPHNPVGKIYSRVELKRMAEICITHGVTIVSDEIHSELLLGDAKFLPLAMISKGIEKHTITLISASKAFNVPGLACAFAIIPDAALREKFSTIMHSLSIEISTPGLTAAHVAYAGKADAWLNAQRRFLTANRNFILNYLDEHLPGVSATVPDATYLMWLDFSEYKLQPSPFEFLLNKAKVAFSPGIKFGRESGQFVRMNFGTSRKIVEEGLKKIRTALH